MKTQFLHYPLLLLSLSGLLCASAQAQPHYFPVDTVINYALEGDVVIGRDEQGNNTSPTVRLPSEGSIDGNVNIFNQSLFRLEGGRVFTTGPYSQTIAHDESHILLNGSTLPELYGYGHSTIDFMSGVVIDYLVMSDNSTLNMSGGSVSFMTQIYGNSTLNLTGGSSPSLLGAYGSPVINMSGGSVASIDLYNDSTLHLRGGEVRSGMYLGQNAVANLYGQNLRAVPDTVTPNHYILSGTLLDGTSVDGKFIDLYQGEGRFILNNVPAPPALLTMLLGALPGAGVLLRRRGDRR